MASRFKNTWFDPAVAAYVAERAAPADDVLTALRRETREATGDRSGMQISADQGSLLTLLAAMTDGLLAVEVGTFTGYSSICIARGLRPEGRMVCCDVSEEFTALARRAWERAGLADRIELRLGPAIDTLRNLPPDEHIDLVFIDADKEGYPAYWDELVPRVKTGGLLLVDNVLWSGRVADPAIDDDVTTAIRAFNDKVFADDRVQSHILPVADGLTVARKR